MVVLNTFARARLPPARLSHSRIGAADRAGAAANRIASPGYFVQNLTVPRGFDAVRALRFMLARLELQLVVDHADYGLAVDEIEQFLACHGETPALGKPATLAIQDQVVDVLAQRQCR